MMFRKWTATLAAAALLVGVTGTALAETVPGAVYGVTPPPQTGESMGQPQVKEALQNLGVKDVEPGHYAGGAIANLVAANLIKPNAAGQILPESTVSVEATASIFAKVLGLASLTDSDEVAAQKAADAGLTTTGAPDAPMPRIGVARLIAEALGVQPKIFVTPANYPFNDYHQTSPEDRAIMMALFELGIFKGFPDKTFRPNEELTVAQIAVLIDRILGAQAN